MESSKNTFTFILLSLLTPLALAAPPDGQSNSSLLWKVTGPELSQPSYVLGTIHLMCEADRKADPRYAAVMEQVDQLIVEITVDTPEKNAQMMQAMVSEVSLAERLSAKQYAQLKDIVKQHTGFDIKLFDKMEMFAISAALLIGTFDCPVVGVEEILEAMAREQGKAIGELETIAEQIKALKAMDPPVRESGWTEDEMKAFGMFPEMFRDILKAYYSEDINAMYRLTLEQFELAENGQDIAAILLDDRNLNWLEKMPGMMQHNPTLFAVGAAHLGGPKGVINLLKEAGYTVTPVAAENF